ncbi:redoxin domain-containing protein [Brevibacterium litoralis]|uniref:redoxin domain-containing protein n=1 Tax=Brevibacterium litoralis TaxID=3138935 RepID=UPI0032EE0C50
MTAAEAPRPGGSPPGVGDPAPGFDLVSRHGEQLDLSEVVARAVEAHGPTARVLIVFYPYAFSPVCSAEMDALTALAPRFRAAGILPVGISTDPSYALDAWAAQAGIGIDLLSDFWPHGAAARAYGVFDPSRGTAIRGTFLVDADSRVVDVLMAGAGSARDFTRFLPPGTDLP